MKYLVAFLAGAAAGAVGMAYLKNKKGNFEDLKPFAREMAQKGSEFRDKIVSQLDSLRDDLAFIMRAPSRKDPAAPEDHNKAL